MLTFEFSYSIGGVFKKLVSLEGGWVHCKAFWRAAYLGTQIQRPMNKCMLSIVFLTEQCQDDTSMLVAHWPQIALRGMWPGTSCVAQLSHERLHFSLEAVPGCPPVTEGVRGGVDVWWAIQWRFCHLSSHRSPAGDSLSIRLHLPAIQTVNTTPNSS